jgi:hypothetical protein
MVAVFLFFQGDFFKGCPSNIILKGTAVDSLRERGQ